MSTPDLSRKVRRLDHDVQEIYVMLADISATQKRHGNRLEELGATQAEHTATLAEHTATLAEHTAILADHGGKLDRIIELLERR